MEENTEEIKEEAEQTAEPEQPELTAEQLLEGKTPLEQVEYYIAWKRLDEAQDLLYKVRNSGKKYYLQSRIYKERKWYNEQRKQLKRAVKEEPDREDYKKELAELEEFAKTKEYKQAVRKHNTEQLGGACAEGGAECCCQGFCLCLCEGICEGIGNGC